MQPTSDHPACVTLVVTTHNYARFLGDALASVFAQTVPAAAVIVVDDGSSDDPRSVAARFPDVEFIATGHMGISHARNVGLARVATDYVMFLDADDMLTPVAIEENLNCIRANPDAGFVYGAYRFVDANGIPTSAPSINRILPRAYAQLLRGNCVRMHATVLYDRRKLQDLGGYAEDLQRCEDYEMYLRMARRHRVASHATLVAEYRLHGSNMSGDVAGIVRWHDVVLDRHRPASEDAEELAAWADGKRAIGRIFAQSVWRKHDDRTDRKWLQRILMIRVAPRMTPVAALRYLVAKVLPRPAIEFLRRVRRRRVSPGVGQIDFGDLARLKPIGTDYGFQRGTPVDRIYIERFLRRHSGLITGHVLEVGEDSYSRRFGTGITSQEVLNIAEGDPNTTIVGDIATPGLIPADSIDCMVLTQMLQYVFDLSAAVREIRNALKPGGAVLATVPALTQVDHAEWSMYWHFTTLSAKRIFADAFGEENVEVEVFGNAFAATCFLQGISVEDIGEEWLEPVDPMFPVTIGVVARKAAA